MEPIDDQKLKEILSEKISEAGPVETSHLWERVASDLPPTSSGLVSGMVKTVIVLTSLISVFTTADSSGYARNNALFSTSIEPSTTQVASNTTSSNRISPRAEEAPLPTLKVMQASSKGHNQKLDNVDQSKGFSLLEVGPVRPAVAELEIALADFDRLANNSHDDRSLIPQKKKGELFIALSPSLTFHSMNPNSYDELYVVSHAGPSAGLGSRIGSNLSVGFTRPLTKRLLLSGSAGFDYYRSHFNYEVANYRNAEVLHRNNRLDMGLRVGLGYQHRSPIGPAYLLGEVWARQQVAAFAPSDYDSGISGYSVAYLLTFADYSVGPTYGSFFNSMYHPLGQIKPHQYGFTIRRKLNF